MSRVIIAVLLAGLPLFAQAADDAAQPRPSAEAMVYDGLFTRPLSLVGTVLGTGLFIATLPFSAIGGNVGEAGEALVVEPARSTFGRCLGCEEPRGAFGM